MSRDREMVELERRGTFRSVQGTRVRIPLVEGSALDALSHTLIVADSTNGLSAEFPIAEYLSIPPGLAVTLD